MRTSSKGTAYITITLAKSKTISVSNDNFLFESELGIQNGSPLYQKLAGLREGGFLREGDAVIFSGEFLRARASEPLDFLREKSVTEEGSMTRPEFVFRFTDVSKAE